MYAVFDKNYHTKEEVSNKTDLELFVLAESDAVTDSQVGCLYTDEEYEDFKECFDDCYVFHLTNL